MFEEEKKRLKEFLAEDEAILKEYVLLGDKNTCSLCRLFGIMIMSV